jgi:hypothetical protein
MSAPISAVDVRSPRFSRTRTRTRFDYVPSLSTVQALGLTIPHNVAAQVTEWAQ